MGVNLIVFGIGNILKMDDGIGIYLTKKLKSFIDKEEAKIYEIETEVWKILPIIEEEKCKNVLIIDAINFGFTPGFVYISRNPEFSDYCFYSLHEKNYLTELMVKKGDFFKNIYIFGVEPYKIDWGYTLSDMLKEKFDEIFQKLFKFYKLILKKEIEYDLLRIKEH